MNSDHIDPLGFTLMTSSELARYLKVSDKVLRRWRKNGEGPRFIKFGIQIAYISTSVEAWVKEQEKLQNDNRTV